MLDIKELIDKYVKKHGFTDEAYKFAADEWDKLFKEDMKLFWEKIRNQNN
tara:strand:- start:530 stop:679 length:150 start_codon:yes stop_codon:yes gene_type:complete